MIPYWIRESCEPLPSGCCDRQLYAYHDFCCTLFMVFVARLSDIPATPCDAALSSPATPTTGFSRFQLPCFLGFHYRVFRLSPQLPAPQRFPPLHRSTQKDPAPSRKPDPSAFLHSLRLSRSTPAPRTPRPAGPTAHPARGVPPARPRSRASPCPRRSRAIPGARDRWGRRCA